MGAGLVDEALVPADGKAASRWSDAFLFWQEVSLRAEMQGRTLTAGFPEFCKSKSPEARRALMQACFDLVGLPAEALDPALEVFKVNSQKGHTMGEKSSGIT